MAIQHAPSLSKDETQTIAQEAFAYLYPLVLMDVTRKQMTNLDPRVNPMGGPANAFTHMPAFPTAEMRAVVRPNFDTLLERLARSDRRPIGRFHRGYRRTLFHAADARYVD